MSKKDYERAAEIVQAIRSRSGFTDGEDTEADDVESAFVEFFSSDNPRFDAARFRAACANVR